MGDTAANDHRAASEIAHEAGELLLGVREELDIHGEAQRVCEAGDRESNRLILARLAERFPDDDVLSEESPLQRGSGERLWIVDPLDGTREFGESGRSDWAVHVALAVDGRLAAGAVALPSAGRVYATPAPPPPPPDRPAGRLRIAVSRTRPPAEAALLAGELGAELVPMGSAGAKAMAVLRGKVDAYVHSGGQYVWDSAAPVAVAQAAGLHASRLDGSELVYRETEPWLPDLLICRPELRDRVLGVLGTLTAR